MERIGQALFISLKGAEISREEREIIQKQAPAGLILFKRNIESGEQVRELIREIKFLTKEAPLMAVDCEGGLVNRLSHLGKEYQYEAPSELLNWDEDRIFQRASQMGRALKELGFDLNFAPVVDLPIVKSPLLETRVFSNSSEEMIKKAGAFMKGLLKERIYPCLKHFPGHGGVREDSHELLPVDHRSWEELKTQREIFECLYEKYPSGLMTAHIVFPQIEKTPASFSKVLLTEKLKKERAFKGMIFSDDIDMGALKGFDLGERVFLALQAGCDMVLSCQKSPVEIFEYFEKQAQKRKSLEKQLKESRLKKKKLMEFLSS